MSFYCKADVCLGLTARVPVSRPRWLACAQVLRGFKEQTIETAGSIWKHLAGLWDEIEGFNPKLLA
jgi:hypothetical protein